MITAYRGRCALSRLREPRLLDAVHIVSDADEAMGQPVVENSLPLSKLHHAAFGSHLVGIDPDYRVRVPGACSDSGTGRSWKRWRHGKHHGAANFAQIRGMHMRLLYYIQIVTAHPPGSGLMSG